MPAAGKIAIKAVAYLNTGNFGTPVWSALTCISDWMVDPTWDFAEGPTRDSRVKKGLKTLLGLAITGKLRDSDSGDANYTTVMAALLTDSVVDMMILSGTNTQNGAKGWRGEFQLVKGSEDQGLGNVIFEDIELRPAITANAFQSVLVTTGAPVFTAI